MTTISRTTLAPVGSLGYLECDISNPAFPQEIAVLAGTYVHVLARTEGTVTVRPFRETTEYTIAARSLLGGAPTVSKI